MAFRKKETMKTNTKTHFIGLELESADRTHEILAEAAVLADKGIEVKGFWLDSAWTKTTPIEGSDDVEALEPVHGVLVVNTAHRMTYKQAGLGVVGLSGVVSILPTPEAFKLLSTITGLQVAG
jgi:hypothetical protein